MQDKTIKISVALATYNGSRYITEQLDSILSQTMYVDEIIICDDKSSDDTVKIINQYIKEKNLSDVISLHVSERNLGYASNFMKAVKMTAGDYIFFCDQDDIWTKQRVQQMVDIMNSNSKILLLGSEFEPFTVSHSAPQVPKWELAKFKGDNSVEHLKYSPENIFIGCQGCTMCVRRSLLDKTLNYWYSGWAHDEFVWKMALCLDGLYFYHNATVKRRVHDDNVSLGKMRDKQKRIKFLEDLYKSHKKTLEFAQSIQLPEKKIKLLEKNMRAARFRIELLGDKKLLNAFRLLFYLECFHKCRALPVEVMMAIRS